MRSPASRRPHNMPTLGRVVRLSDPRPPKSAHHRKPPASTALKRAACGKSASPRPYVKTGNSRLMKNRFQSVRRILRRTLLGHSTGVRENTPLLRELGGREPDRGSESSTAQKRPAARTNLPNPILTCPNNEPGPDLMQTARALNREIRREESRSAHTDPHAPVVPDYPSTSTISKSNDASACKPERDSEPRFDNPRRIHRNRHRAASAATKSAVGACPRPVSRHKGQKPRSFNDEDQRGAMLTQTARCAGHIGASRSANGRKGQEGPDTLMPWRPDMFAQKARTRKYSRPAAQTTHSFDERLGQRKIIGRTRSSSSRTRRTSPAS